METELPLEVAENVIKAQWKKAEELVDKFKNKCEAAKVTMCKGRTECRHYHWGGGGGGRRGRKRVREGGGGGGGGGICTKSNFI